MEGKLEYHIGSFQVSDILSAGFFENHSEFEDDALADTPIEANTTIMNIHEANCVSKSSSKGWKREKLRLLCDNFWNGLFGWDTRDCPLLDQGGSNVQSCRLQQLQILPDKLGTIALPGGHQNCNMSSSSQLYDDCGNVYSSQTETTNKQLTNRHMDVEARIIVVANDPLVKKVSESTEEVRDWIKQDLIKVIEEGEVRVLKREDGRRYIVVDVSNSIPLGI
ncbi:hypothetical protein FOA43_003397 [Brettanomyces nanus]|uniref:Uncharacterized protein n=1 Tax=Eeniella nana TaxID=13502 RepID=A0A875S2S6_EENNA|nr:uncharacterized protein FOA43_003397 [Brettanomyces nanus]QPG76011.1 hypothetical protein FOA43_003397 [Brettanomyces nanus]